MKRIGQDTENTQATDQGVNFDQVVAGALSEDGVLPTSAITFGIYQCRLESNNYLSNVFLTCNNLNGYKSDGEDIQNGPCLLSPEGDYYAGYTSVENSAHQLSQWWQNRVAKNGFDLTTLTSITAYANALYQFGWYTSSPTAYAARMLGVSTLVSFQSSTGINTEGFDLTTMGALTAGAMLLLVLAMRK
jgi:hypothetical protein